ncbi:MFS transporter [Litchfieldella qijiaojingensis]|uniref:MFS transporter n=1 Tax=Litchfieldella qijiaojingensis TaxID=980347 RepID=A0ABQ2YXB1_9GAMM|nr:MFS transporter [Halomonas qijiaojingensis]GGX96167.1 MFS transporter [Halomonas qijiaojingensis]
MPPLIIAIAELFGTALWFTPNAVLHDLQVLWSLRTADLGWLTGAVQGGFLLGTLTIGLQGLADRLDASRLFAACCLLGALSNALLPWAGGLWGAVTLRVITGMCLAGIYPVGMKLMVGWTPGRTGLGLALLVGMLVLGTALPHGLRAFSELPGAGMSWRIGILGASGLALLAGILVWRLGEAPDVQAAKSHASATATSRLIGIQAFHIKDFRRAASAYFGHMWELYTLWALLPLMLLTALPDLSTMPLALGAFGLIAIGGPACWLGGWLSQSLSSRRVAQLGLAGSATCCALYPLLTWLPTPLLIAFLALWSALAVVDSPQFSALSAAACPTTIVGSALTLQNAIGFAVSMLSLLVLIPLWQWLGSWLAWLLLPGPLFGLWCLSVRRRLSTASPADTSQ